MKLRRKLLLLAMVTTQAVLLPVGSAMAVAAGQPTCGQSVTSDVTLSADLTCSGAALVINASASVELAGHAITGNIDINAPKVNYALRDGRIKGQVVETTTELGPSPGGTLTDIVLDGSVSQTGGVTVTDSTIHGDLIGVVVAGMHELEVKLKDSTVGEINGGPFITISNSTTGLVSSFNTGLTVKHSVVAGFDIDLTGISLVDSRVGSLGIRSYDSYGLTMDNDIVVGAQVGLSWNGPNGVAGLQITNSHFIDNGVGMMLGVGSYPRYGIDITGNTFTGNARRGLDIVLLHSSIPALVSNNEFVDNGGDGLRLNGPFTVTGNTATGNGGYGIHVIHGNGPVTGTGNFASGNGQSAQCLGIVCAL